MPYKKLIAGKTYDTETATLICTLQDEGSSRFDYDWENTALYCSPMGQFFLAGEGGAGSRWARPVPGGGGTKSNGSGLILIDSNEARRLAEQYDLDQDMYAEFFGPILEG